MTTKIQQELYNATDFEPVKGEKKQEGLKRLVEAIDELDDQQFSTLTREARVWADTATKAVLAKSTIPGFEPEEEEEEGETEAEVEEPEETSEEEEPAPQKTSSNGVKRTKRVPVEAPTRKTSPKVPVKVVDERLARPRSHMPTGRKKHVHDCLVKNPNASVDEIIRYLEKKGQEVPTRITIATFRSGFRSVVESLARHNKLSEPMELSGKRQRRRQRL